MWTGKSAVLTYSFRDFPQSVPISATTLPSISFPIQSPPLGMILNLSFTTHLPKFPLNIFCLLPDLPSGRFLRGFPTKICFLFSRLPIPATCPAQLYFHFNSYKHGDGANAWGFVRQLSDTTHCKYIYYS